MSERVIDTEHEAEGLPALVVGATGLRGGPLADRPVGRSWIVVGVLRNSPATMRWRPVAADLPAAKATTRAPATLNPTHIFFKAWSRHATGAKDCDVERAMLTSVLEAVAGSPSLRDVALTTGLKHYLDPFASALAIETAEHPGHPTPPVEQMADAASVWDAALDRYGSAPHPIDKLASWWHSDLELGRTLESLTDMTKSRLMGSYGFQPTHRSFLDPFDRMRAERITPPVEAVRSPHEIPTSHR